MSGRDKAFFAAGAAIMLLATVLKLFSTLTVVQFSVLLSVGFIILAHSLDYKKRALNARDEFIRHVNQNSMARSWRVTQYLVVALLFATVLHWITLSTVWALIIVSVFMTLSYVLFMIPLFQKGDVE